MAILSPKREPQIHAHFFIGRLAPLAFDRSEENYRMGHISVAAGGLSQRQIDAVTLDGAQLRLFWKRLTARLSRALS